MEKEALEHGFEGPRQFHQVYVKKGERHPSVERQRYSQEFPASSE